MAPAADANNPPGLIRSSSQAAGPRILLRAGGIVQARNTLSDEAKMSIRAILQQAKSKTEPGSIVTDAELEKFLDLVFADQWSPGKFCEGGDSQMCRRFSHNCAYQIGTL